MYVGDNEYENHLKGGGQRRPLGILETFDIMSQVPVVALSVAI